MTAIMQADGYVDVEAMCRIDSVEVAIAEIEDKAERWAELGAMYAHGGTYNDVRKMLLSATAVRIREARLAVPGTKVTDGQIDELAHADTGYRAFVDLSTDERKEYLALCTQREMQLLRSNRHDLILRAFTYLPR